VALDFPSPPSVGQIYPNPAVAGVPQWQWDGSEWKPMFQSSLPQLSCKVTQFLASGPYTPTVGTQFAIFEAVGAGAGGGGVAGVATTNAYNGGGGGGGGTYARKLLTIAQIGAGGTVTVGAGGNGGAAGANPGAAGGATFIAIGGTNWCLAPAGSQGNGVSGVASFGQGGAGGTVGQNCDFFIQGQAGGNAFYTPGTSQSVYIACNNGGNSGWGGGGGKTTTPGAGATSVGAAGVGYGGGGSGANFQAVGANAAGGKGQDGMMLVTEFGFFGSPVPQGITRINQIRITATGTYVPSPGLIMAWVRGVGGGGGGGGVLIPSGTNSYAGSGGSSGGYSEKWCTAADIGVSQAVTIGAGGVAGVAGTSNGGAGGQTSFGSLLVANGGPGGIYASNTQVPTTPAGAGVGIGDIAMPGNPGEKGGWTATSTTTALGGSGGASHFGGPGVGGAGQSSGAAGFSATGYGSGGGGGAIMGITGNVNGGAGMQGVVFVTEYLAF
jgi:hypothetical protein